MAYRLTSLILASLLSQPVLAANPINAGQIQTDPATPNSLGFNFPYSGDDNRNAYVEVAYRLTGKGYKRAFNMLRVDADHFAGSIVDLTPGTTYEIRIDVIDPEGGAKTFDLVEQTRRLPSFNPSNVNIVKVSSQSQLGTAISKAKPGDVIFLQNGTYAGPIVLNQAGTPDNPIVLRGESVSGVIVQSPEVSRSASYCDGNAVLEVRASNVYVENITFKGEMWGALLGGSSSYDNIAIRNSGFLNNHCGINAAGGSSRNFYICDNVLSGKFSNENTGRETWNIEGIVITGEGHTICHNTLSGYGDTIDIPNQGQNRAIDVFGNEILWGGDDGLELDGGERNIRAFRNRIANSGTGISVQPGGGGPFYLFRNIIYNSGLEYLEGGQLSEVYLPFKIKNGAAGIYIYHNTAVRPGSSWTQSESLENSQVLNNLLLGTSQGVSIYPGSDSVIDYNGYNVGSPVGNNGIKLGADIFSPPDQILSSGTTDWRPYFIPGPLTLSSKSAAVDAGVPLPNFNDDSISLPDLGAIELGQTPPVYGVRTNLDVMAPDAPKGLLTE